MRFEALVTALVQRAPAVDRELVGELVAELRGIGSIPAAGVTPAASSSGLARAIARVAELVADGRVDPGIALPPLAMASATLADGLRGKLAAPALEAARYEIETLLPVAERAPRATAPDVPLAALRRR